MSQSADEAIPPEQFNEARRRMEDLDAILTTSSRQLQKEYEEFQTFLANPYTIDPAQRLKFEAWMGRWPRIVESLAARVAKEVKRVHELKTDGNTSS